MEIFDFELSADDMKIFSKRNIGWRHCTFIETGAHPDYPFPEEKEYGWKPPKALGGAFK